MENMNMKNMMVVRNLPSNVIEEAFIIIKPNLKIKQKKQVREREEKKEIESQKNQKEYILKEAELLLSDYAKGIEKKEKNGEDRKLEKKYKRLKWVAVMTSILGTMGWLYAFL